MQVKLNEDIINSQHYGYIYKLTNIINNKEYIGQVIQKNNRVAKRINEYELLKCKRQPKIYNALLKYTPAVFIFEIIDFADNANDLNLKEIEYISQHNTIKNGYNVHPGGKGGSAGHSLKTRKLISEIRKNEIYPNINRQQTASVRFKHSIALKGRQFSDEHKRNISIAHTGKILSDEHKRKISAAHVGKPSGMLGKHHSDETKLLISQAFTGKQFSDDHKRKISESHKGITHTLEARQKMSIAKKGRIPWNKGLRKNVIP